MEGVRTQHPLYTKRLSQWKKMRDVMEGSDVIKAAGEEYLPRPSTAHKKYDIYEQRQYEAFKERAVWTGYTAQIHDCLHGMGEARPAKINVPSKIREKGVLTNVDYQGNTLDQFQSDVLADVLITGFGGILIDVPKVDPNMSVLNAEKMNVRPYMAYYKAESIINWKYKVINGIKTLALVVLQEEVDLSDDPFSHEMRKQYRVLSLNANNECIQAVYGITKTDEGKEIEELLYSKPIQVNGKPVDYIPFVMLPFNEPVKPILYDIALNNISHYQISADYQNGAHLTSRPTLCFTGHAPELDKEGNEVPIYVGTDIVWQLPEPEAKAYVVSFSGEGISHLEQALNRVEGHIITLASHVIAAEKKTAENKDALSIHRQGEDAKLATYLRYFSLRFTAAMKIIAQWLGCNDAEVEDVLIELPSDFSTMTFDANAVNSIANIFSQGKLPLNCLYYLLQQGGYLPPDMTYEGFVYLLDLEASSLNPQEVEEAYKMFKKKGVRKELNTGDWYSSQNLYEEKEQEVKNGLQE